MPDKFTSEFSVQTCLLLDQALDKIAHCLDQLNDEQLWWRPKPELNSVGNLLLHACGNLQQWCTVLLEHLPDSRDRDAEFSTALVPRQQLEELIQQTTDQAKSSIMRLTRDQLLRRVVVQGFNVNIMNAILHTVTHFQGHTHQIILLTRLQTGEDYQYHWTSASGKHRLPM